MCSVHHLVSDSSVLKTSCLEALCPVTCTPSHDAPLLLLLLLLLYGISASSRPGGPSGDSEPRRAPDTGSVRVHLLAGVLQW